MFVGEDGSVHRRPGVSRLVGVRAPAVALAIGLLGLACGTSMLTRIEGAPGADLSRYRSFAVLPLDPTSLVGTELLYGDLSEDALESAAVRALEARGYARAAPGAADLLVRVRALLRDRVYEVVRPTGHGATVVSVRQVVREGTVVVDVLEASSGKRVWGGSAVARIAGRERLEGQIQAGIAAVLARYPPPGAGSPP